MSTITKVNVGGVDYDLGGGGGEESISTYYLSDDVRNISMLSTPDEILEKIGGAEKITEIHQAINDNKRICLKGGGTAYYSMQVNACNMVATVVLCYPKINVLSNVNSIITIRLNSDPTVTESFLEGALLREVLWNLTNESSSSDISSALGLVQYGGVGKEGLRNMITAIKHGNRLVLQIKNLEGTEGLTTYATATSASYLESENGDMQLLLSFRVYALMGYVSKNFVISYVKSIDTFSVIVNSAS